jgi:hypothetical protein
VAAAPPAATPRAVSASDRLIARRRAAARRRPLVDALSGTEPCRRPVRQEKQVEAGPQTAAAVDVDRARPAVPTLCPTSV